MAKILEKNKKNWRKIMQKIHKIETKKYGGKQ